MDTVLIVEDDKSFQLSLVDGFKAYKDKFQTLIANDGLEALTILNKQEVNLVLTDLKMPRMDGFELMAHLSTNYPEIPVIIMTAFGTPDMEKSLRGMGASQYIEKPIDFSSLVEKVLAGLESTSKGFVTGVSLTSFLQLLEIDKKSCTLTVHSGKTAGTIYFKEGDLIDAISPNKTGIEAAYEIIGWNNVKIEIANACLVTERAIQEPLGYIILEASRLQDERDEDFDEEETQDERDDVADEEIAALHEQDEAAGIHEATRRPAGTSEMPAEAPAASKPLSSMKQYINLLESKQEIFGFIILARTGQIIQNTISTSEKLGQFITYLAAAGEEIRKALGTKGGRQFTLLRLSGDKNIMILAGKQMITGLEIDKSTQPEIMADRLRNALKTITSKQ